MIAGPSDVSSHKTLIREQIDRWNTTPGRRSQAVVTSFMWETDSTPILGDSAQAVINRQLADECDSIIAVFGSRLGSPTADAESGTVEEIERFLNASKPASVLFFEGDAPIAKIDAAQLTRLREFKERYQAKGLLGTFTTADGLIRLVDGILVNHVETLLGNTTAVTAPAPSAGSVEQKEEVSPIGPALDAFGEDRIQDGISILKAQWDRMGESRPTWPGYLAPALAFGFLVNHSDASFDELIKVATENPEDAEAQFYAARALEKRGDNDAAIKGYESALARQKGIHSAALRGILRVTVSSKGYEKALQRTGEMLLSYKDVRQKAELIRTFASVLQASDDERGRLDAIRLREYSEQLHATTKSEEQLAEFYGKTEADQPLALFYYRELADSEDDPTHTTNVGYYAGNLGLPILAVDQYTKAAAAGEPYAIANKARNYLAAGFVEDARSVLEKARDAKVKHREIEKVTGAVAEAEEAEGERVDELTKAAETVRKQRAREAKAMLETPHSTESMGGPYEGNPGHSWAHLAIGNDGLVAGSFQLNPTQIATLTGTMVGNLLRCSWETTPKAASSGVLALLDVRRTGIANMIWDGKNELEGFTLQGHSDLNSENVGAMVPWKLIRDSRGSIFGKLGLLIGPSGEQ